MQSAFSKYTEILKFHGPLNDLRRCIDQFLEVDLYDIKNHINTGEIQDGNVFYDASKSASATMHYQPVYTDALKKPLKFLKKNYAILGASSIAFIDLGCGRGKTLHMAGKIIQQINLIGIDLQKELLESAKRNISTTRIPINKLTLINQNVNDVDYLSITQNFDALIVFNKNSFDRGTTINSIEKIRNTNKGKDIFYIYNNPVFEAIFKEDELVFSMKGWHKNWNTNVYRLKT